MASTAFIVTFIACILLHDSCAQQLGRVPPAQISVRNPGERGLAAQISVSNPGERGLIPSQPYFPGSQSPSPTNQEPNVHPQEYLNAHLGQVQGEGIAVQDHAYRVSAPGTAKPLAPVVLQALQAIQSNWASTQAKPHSLKEEDHQNEIPNRSQRTHRRAQRLVHPLQGPLTEFHGLFASVRPTPRPSSQNMDINLRSIVPEEHRIDRFQSSPTKTLFNQRSHRPQSLNTVTSPSPIKSTPIRTQHSDLGLLLHSGIPARNSQVRHPLLDLQIQTRPVAPPTTGFLQVNSQEQPQLGFPQPNFKQSNNHLIKNQTQKLAIKESSKSTEPFLAVFEQFSPNSNKKVFPDYDDEEYYYYDDYNDTYYDDYDYGLSGSPITPLPFHVTTTNHFDPPVTTPVPSVTTRTRSRGPITPPPSLFPVRPGQTASPAPFPFSVTKQPTHSNINSKIPVSFGFNNKRTAIPVHLVTSAPRIVEIPTSPRHQVFNALQTPARPHGLIQQPHPLHGYFIGDTSGILLKQSRRFPTSTDIKSSSSCPECSANPDKLIFPASPLGLRAPLSQDPKGIFNPEGSQTLVVSKHLLHRLHHGHTTAAPHQRPTYFTPKRSVSQPSFSPLKRLRRRKRRRYPSDYAVDTTQKQRLNQVPEHVEKTGEAEIISNLKRKNPINNKPRKKIAPTVDFSQRNRTRKLRRIKNKTNSSILATSNTVDSTSISPTSYARLPLPGLTASKKNVGGIPVQPRSISHHSQSISTNNAFSTSGNNMGHTLISPFSGVPTLESATPEEITRAASAAVQGWRQDLRYPVVELPLPSAALSGLPFVIDGHKHLGTFVVVAVT